MLTKTHIQRLQHRFDNGEKPKLPRIFWELLVRSIRKEDWYGDRVWTGNRWINLTEQPQYLEALKSFGLLNERGNPTKLGHFYYDNWSSING